MKKVLVQLGNDNDTNGAYLVEGIIVREYNAKYGGPEATILVANRWYGIALARMSIKITENYRKSVDVESYSPIVFDNAEYYCTNVVHSSAGYDEDLEALKLCTDAFGHVFTPEILCILDNKKG